MGSGKLLLGVIAGISTGALIGILLVPNKADHTKKMVPLKPKDYDNGFESELDDLIARINVKYQSRAKLDSKLNLVNS